MPRVHRLEVPDVVTADEEDIAEAPVTEDQEMLVAVDTDDAEDGANKQCTKQWLSSTRAIGCFSYGPRDLPRDLPRALPQDFLKEIGTLTGTEITVESQMKSLQISGKNPGDVEEALERLTRLDNLLVSCFVLC
jgi:hypothetical protein